MTHHEINITKRSGQKELFQLQKWQAQIAKVCEGVADVSPSMIEIAASPHFYNGMTTVELDQIALRAMVGLIDEESNAYGNVNYQYVAGKQRISMLRKDVYGSYQPPALLDIVKKNIELGLYTHELLEWYSEEDWDYLNKHIEHGKDELMSFAAVEQLVDKYLVRNRATGKIVETPQVRYMIAAATAFHAETKDRLKWVKDFYNAASDGLFTLATPVLAGLGTKTKQFSSCVLLKTDDTLKSIFATGQVMADYASKRAGIGLEIGRMRPLGAAIRGGEVMHTGILPFLKKWYGDLRSCSQGGIRNASATVNMPIWHYQFDDYIVLKNNKGTEENRVRQLDYCVVLSSFFWRRFRERANITFFDPNQVPDLYQAFYSDSKLFEELYVKYEHRKDLTKKVVAAETVFKDWILTERMETGRIYILNIDNVSNQGSFDTVAHPIYQTNLCTEIMLPTKPFQTVDDPDGRIALCTLGSNNWGAFRNPEDMRRPLRLLHRFLHNILQYQDFLSVHSFMHNKEFEPLGIGITNLAYWHAKRKLKYGEAEALAEVKRWIEHQAFYLTEMSVELAKEKGKCLESDNTWYGKGVFPWERRAPGVNELTDFTPSDDLDWEGLREKMKTYGVRNATWGAIAPVESSSVCINSTNGINLAKELIVTKRSKGGDIIQVVPEYKRLKNHYQLLWQQKDCLGYLKTSAVLQAFIDQGISTDMFFSPRNYPDGKIDINDVIKAHMLFHKWGGKSLYYALVEKQAAMESVKDAGDFFKHLPEENEAVVDDEGSEEYCESCVL